MLMLLLVLTTDTTRIESLARPAVFDGLADIEEYGLPSLELPGPAGPLRFWLRRDGGVICIAASLPDRSMAWSDALVVSLDTRGDRTAGPGHDDFQWEFHRVLDSSVVLRGDAGRWRLPQDNPDWRLGAARDGGGWEVRSVSDATGWTLELRLDAAYFAEARGGHPGLALRVFDNDPQRWTAWPDPAGLRHPTEVERRPERWAVVVETRPTGGSSPAP